MLNKVARGTADRTDVMTDIHLFLHDYDRMIKKHDFTCFIKKYQNKIVEFLKKSDQNTVIFTGFSLGVLDFDIRIKGIT